MITPKFAQAEVALSTIDGNAFSIMGATIKALKAVGATPDEIKEYQAEAMSGSYENLVKTTMEWVEIS